MWYVTWSVTLREEHTSRVFEKRLLGRIIGQKRDKAVGGCRRLHNEEFHNLYTSPKVINSKKKRWAGHVASMGEIEIQI
jgi:hypothetical protein